MILKYFKELNHRKGTITIYLYKRYNLSIFDYEIYDQAIIMVMIIGRL